MNEQNRNNQDINLKRPVFFIFCPNGDGSCYPYWCSAPLSWLRYAQSPFVYFRQATVIIKDPSNKTTTAGLDRYDNYINKVNVANEILQFRSKKLMQEVVKRVHADISYLHKEGLRENELYTKAPVAVVFPDATPEQYLSFKVTPRDKQTVTVSDFMGTEKDKVCQVGLNDTVDVNGVRMVISPTNYYTDAWLEKIVRVQKNPLAAVAGYYRGNLGIRQEEDDSSILTLSLKDSSPHPC